MGKLIVIEGLDCSGKQTQTELLCENLGKMNIGAKKVSFPDYESDCSAPIKHYLAGDFGKNASDVNPYVASTFYTVDRFSSFKTKWQDFYDGGGVVLADRYTTSNMIHQASKIECEAERDKYLSWLLDFEYNVFSLPKPDLVIFLDVMPSVSREIMRERANKITGESGKDIHEGNDEYLNKCYNAAREVCEKYGFLVINCTKDNKLRPIGEIQQDILKEALRIIK